MMAGVQKKIKETIVTTKIALRKKKKLTACFTKININKELYLDDDAVWSRDMDNEM